MVNEWTRDDLPTVDEAAETYMAKGVYSVQEGIALVLDAVVDHLNAHRPKPVPGMLWATKTDAARWRRAHEIVEQERDEARAERDEAERERNEMQLTAIKIAVERDKHQGRAEAAERERDQARKERDEAQASERESQELRARMKELLDGVSNAVNPPEPPLVRWGKHDLPEKVREVVRERDEWKARAEAAEARTAPAVTREDVKNVVDGVLSTWHVNEDVVDAVCDLFGIEAEDVDPVGKLADEFARDLARNEHIGGAWSMDPADWRDVTLALAKRAKDVLGQEGRHVDQ